MLVSPHFSPSHHVAFPLTSVVSPSLHSSFPSIVLSFVLIFPLIISPQITYYSRSLWFPLYLASLLLIAFPLTSPASPLSNPLYSPHMPLLSPPYHLVSSLLCSPFPIINTQVSQSCPLFLFVSHPFFPSSPLARLFPSSTFHPQFVFFPLI